MALKATINAFKTPAIYIRGADQSQISLNCVFDTPHQSVNPQTGVPIDSTAPTAGIRLLDLGLDLNGNANQPDPDGDTLILNGFTYRVMLSTEDGQGGTTLQLGKIT